MKLKFCLKCKNTGRILEQRLSEYINSFDYYPIPCPDCQGRNITDSRKELSYSLNFFGKYIQK